MIFVPLPLFATLCLCYGLMYLLRTRDMGARSNQLFAGLIGLYALQSFLLCLRWGYQVEQAAIWIAILAPVLPVWAYFAYLCLMDKLTRNALLPMSVLSVVWVTLVFAPQLADAAILVTYFGAGAAILKYAISGENHLGLVRIGQTGGVVRAMVLTGIALICSAFVDLFIIVDFISTGGRNIGLTITLIQTGFLLCIGLAALVGQTVTAGDEDAHIVEPSPEDTQEDEAIIVRLTQLFHEAGLHKDTDLNLRRLSRRLGLPDRRVSQAINKSQNMSVSQFVNGFRIKEACALLETSDQSILQISLAAGFLSKSNFNREFARVTGQSPSHWRQSRPHSH